MADKALVPLFVYGTLQPGLPLWHMIAAEVHGTPMGAVAKGVSLHSNRNHTYPYMVPAKSQNSRVFGTLLALPLEGAFGRVSEMEASAGYTTRVVDVVTYTRKPQGGVTKNELEAVAFMLREEYRGLLGAYIPRGDWTEYVTEVGTVVDDVEEISCNQSRLTLATES